MVSDRQVALVRAMLFGELESAEALKAEVRSGGPEAERTLVVLLNAVFDRAARRRFGPETTYGDIIRFVARARTTGTLRTEQVDVRLAERLLVAYLNADQQAVQDVDPVELTLLVSALLVELSPYPPDANAVDELLAEARECAERVLKR